MNQFLEEIKNFRQSSTLSPWKQTVINLAEKSIERHINGDEYLCDTRSEKTRLGKEV
jgi:hypothetical protein